MTKKRVIRFSRFEGDIIYIYTVQWRTRESIKSVLKANSTCSFIVFEFQRHSCTCYLSRVRDSNAYELLMLCYSERTVCDLFMANFPIMYNAFGA